MKVILTHIFLWTSLCLYSQIPFETVRVNLESNNFRLASIALDSCIREKYHIDSCYFYKTLLHLREQKNKSAIQLRDKIEKEYPEFYLVHYLNGIILFEQNDYGKSIAAFNKVLKIDPKHFKSLYNRALALGMLEDYDAAISDLTACIDLAPGFSPALYSRAYWYELNANYDDAIKDYEAVIRINSKNFDAYLGIAHCYLLQKNTVKACEFVEKAIAAGSQMAEDVKESYCR